MNTGLSLEDALRGLASSEDLAQLDALGNDAARPVAYWTGDACIARHHQYCSLHEPLEKVLIAALRQGELVATGFELPMTAQSRKVEIAAEAWEVLEPDFENSAAKGGELRLIKIEVCKRSDKLEDPRENVPSASNPAAITLSEDDKLLTVKGRGVYLRGEIQQSIMRKLVEAHRTGVRLRQAEVLRYAGSNADTIPKAFNGSPNWPFLKTIVRRDGGECWLQID